MAAVQPVSYQPQPGAPPGAMAQGMPQQQPQWMNKPQPIAGCPPGLEYLTTLDQVVVKQHKDLLEAFTGWEQANKYRIFNNQSQQVFFAAEESDVCMRQCCGPNRGFDLHITDNLQQEVIKVHRDFKCCAGCAWCASADCCAFTVDVEAPVGQRVAYIRQEFTCLAPKYTIRNAEDQIIFRIEGPVCIFPMCGGQDFVVTSEETGQEVGKITKQFAGLVTELFTNADTFGVTFPMDLDVTMKAAMIGAVFLIDFMYFEQNQNQGHY